MIVLSKFGGSSLADAEEFKKVKKIVLSDPARHVVIVSAIGKRNEKDNKITDLLYILAAHIKYKVDYSSIMDTIRSRYEQVGKDLSLTFDLESEFKHIELKAQEGADEDYIVSRGEYLSARLMAEYLGFQFIDADSLIFFTYSGRIDYEKTDLAVKEAFDKFGYIVVPGFYGAYPDKKVKVFSRGGSDLTGSIIARGIHADKYENWTDVSGLLMADPHIVCNPKKIEEITYDELRELSYMGAKVLHEDTIYPIKDFNIPIAILNTNHPEDKGTIIINSSKDNSQIITGISGKHGYMAITVVKKHSADKSAFLSNMITIFGKYHAVIEHIPTGIDSFSVIVEKESIARTYHELIAELKANEETVDVTVDDDIALLAVVGRNMATKPGIAAKIFNSFGSNEINIKMIVQSSTEITIIIGVANKDMEAAIKALYHNMIQ